MSVQAIILGPKPFTRLVAQDLQAAGVGAFVPTESAPETLSGLKEVLHQWKLRSQEEGFSPLIHPGTGIWGERPELVTFAGEMGIPVIAPPARVLSLFANKLNLLLHAERLNVPNLLSVPDPLHSIREIEQLLEKSRLRFPFILKSVKSNEMGGHLVVHAPEDLQTRLPLWLEQVRRSSGEVMLLAERYLEGARLIVVPFSRMGTVAGEVETYATVDASLQCRHRKMIEFCPANGIDPSVEQRLRKWTADLARSSGFVGVGTLEFLVEGSRAYLVNGSARLNSTYRLWERVSGVSAVQLQVAALQGIPPAAMKDRPTQVQDGLALRFFAEDPLLQLPQPGSVQEVSQRHSWNYEAASADFWTTLAPGSTVEPSSSGLLGVLAVFARDRLQTVTVAKGVLNEIWIAGSLQTNQRFLAEVLSHPWVREGMFHAGFVDEEFLPAVRPDESLLPIFGAVCAQVAGPSAAGARWAVGDLWVKGSPNPDSLKWVSVPNSFCTECGLPGVTGVVELPDGRKTRVCAYPLTADKWQVTLGTWILHVRRASPKPKNAPKTTRQLHALVPGRVHSLLFLEGANISPHEPLLVIESLGMFVPHAIPTEACLEKWRVIPDQLVRAGQELADLDCGKKLT